MALGSRLFPSGVLQVPTYFDDYTGSTISLGPDWYRAGKLDEIIISPLTGGVAKREYSNGTLAVAQYFDEVQLSNYPSSTTPTFNTSVNRTFAGYGLGARLGWSYGAEVPSSYDDGYAFFDSITYPIIPYARYWYMNGVGYNTYYVSSNGYLTFGSGSGAIISAPQTSPAGFYLCPGDNYWATNAGTNGTANTPNAFAFRRGVTSNGWQFFSANMQAYTFGNTSNDKSWELNCFFNSDNSVQFVEFTYGPVFGSGGYTGTAGVSNGSLIYTASTTPAANITLSFSSLDKGVTWTYAGQGSWSVGTF